MNKFEDTRKYGKNGHLRVSRVTNFEDAVIGFDISIYFNDKEAYGVTIVDDADPYEIISALRILANSASEHDTQQKET